MERATANRKLVLYCRLRLTTNDPRCTTDESPAHRRVSGTLSDGRSGIFEAGGVICPQGRCPPSGERGGCPQPLNDRAVRIRLCHGLEAISQFTDSQAEGTKPLRGSRDGRTRTDGVVLPRPEPYSSLIGRRPSLASQRTWGAAPLYPEIPSVGRTGIEPVSPP